ncbi:hypothetical protein EDD86DRAFT_198975 [Gorgonomyces haynaldii]|nr:hypothetical protein EDD86DRAFT_198975 [Gorgonomyces haynaldii]
MRLTTRLRTTTITIITSAMSGMPSPRASLSASVKSFTPDGEGATLAVDSGLTSDVALGKNPVPEKVPVGTRLESVSGRVESVCGRVESVSDCPEMVGRLIGCDNVLGSPVIVGWMVCGWNIVDTGTLKQKLVSTGSPWLSSVGDGMHVMVENTTLPFLLRPSDDMSVEGMCASFNVHGLVKHIPPVSSS